MVADFHSQVKIVIPSLVALSMASALHVVPKLLVRGIVYSKFLRRMHYSANKLQKYIQSDKV